MKIANHFAKRGFNRSLFAALSKIEQSTLRTDLKASRMIRGRAPLRNDGNGGAIKRHPGIYETTQITDMRLACENDANGPPQPSRIGSINRSAALPLRKYIRLRV
jgi:hypothetical protein